MDSNTTAAEPVQLTEPAWEQQFHLEETDPAYRAFCQYYTNDDSLKKIFKTESAVRQAEKWSSKFRWVERRRAWFYQLQKQAEEKARVDIEKMNERHAEQARAFGAVLSQVQAAFLVKVTGEAGKQELENMSLEDMLTLITKGASVLPRLHEAEAIARGVTPKTRHEHTGVGGAPIETKSVGMEEVVAAFLKLKSGNEPQPVKPE